MFTGYRCALALVIGLATVGHSGAAIIDSSGAGFSIPDNNASGVTSTISLSVDETITNVEVNLFDLTHTWVGDLVGRLTSPSGTTADLFFRVGPGTFGDGSNLNGNYSFADGGANFAAAAASLGGNSTIRPGLYQPATDGDGAVSLAAAFAGESTLGQWTLFISDNAQADSGSISGWGLNISSNITAVPEPGCLLLVVLTGMVMVKRRRRVSASA